MLKRNSSMQGKGSVGALAPELNLLFPLGNFPPAQYLTDVKSKIFGLQKKASVSVRLCCTTCGVNLMNLNLENCCFLLLQRPEGKK